MLTFPFYREQHQTRRGHPTSKWRPRTRNSPRARPPLRVQPCGRIPRTVPSSSAGQFPGQRDGAVQPAAAIPPEDGRARPPPGARGGAQKPRGCHPERLPGCLTSARWLQLGPGGRRRAEPAWPAESRSLSLASSPAAGGQRVK